MPRQGRVYKKVKGGPGRRPKNIVSVNNEDIRPSSSNCVNSSNEINVSASEKVK